MLLDDRVAIVSGVGPGLGRSIALGLAHEGANVVLAARNAERLTRVGDEVRALGRHALEVPTDIADPDACRALVAACATRFERCDVLVNSGHHQGDFTPCLDSDLAAWPDVFAVNLYGPMHLIQAVVPMMRAQGGGSIININSGAVISSKPTLGAYSASKSALASVTKTLALELGRDHIRVNGMYVSSMVGDNILDWGKGEAEREGISVEEWLARKSASEFALGQMPHPDDIAGTAVFLASNLARAVTGQNISVNNGQWVEGLQ